MSECVILQQQQKKHLTLFNIQKMLIERTIKKKKIIVFCRRNQRLTVQRIYACVHLFLVDLLVALSLLLEHIRRHGDCVLYFVRLKRCRHNIRPLCVRMLVLVSYWARFEIDNKMPKRYTTRRAHKLFYMQNYCTRTIATFFSFSTIG